VVGDATTAAITAEASEHPEFAALTGSQSESGVMRCPMLIKEAQDKTLSIVLKAGPHVRAAGCAAQQYPVPLWP
jgi:hypothetical protein